MDGRTDDEPGAAAYIEHYPDQRLSLVSLSVLVQQYPVSVFIVTGNSVSPAVRPEAQRPPDQQCTGSAPLSDHGPPFMA